MSEAKELTAEEEAEWRNWCHDFHVGIVGALMYERMARIFATLDASRARERALVEALREARAQLFALCEETEENEPNLGYEGKQGAFARGRVFEAKGIRRAWGEWYATTLSTIFGPNVTPAPSDCHPQEG